MLAHKVCLDMTHGCSTLDVSYIYGERYITHHAIVLKYDGVVRSVEGVGEQMIAAEELQEAGAGRLRTKSAVTEATGERASRMIDFNAESKVFSISSASSREMTAPLNSSPRATPCWRRSG